MLLFKQVIHRVQKRRVVHLLQAVVLFVHIHVKDNDLGHLILIIVIGDANGVVLIPVTARVQMLKGDGGSVLVNQVHKVWVFG